MQRSQAYSQNVIKSTLRRHKISKSRRLSVSVGSPEERIAFLLDASPAINPVELSAWLLQENFNLLAGKTVAICSSFHFGELFSLANDLKIEIETLVVLPGASQSKARADAFAACLTSVIDAGKGNGRLFWFAGRVAFMVPTKTPLEVWLGEMKGHEMIPATRLDHWPREGLRTLVASTCRIKAIPFRNIVRLADHEKWGSLLAVSEIEHCGPNFAFLKDLAPQLPNSLACLD